MFLHNAHTHISTHVLRCELEKHYTVHESPHNGAYTRMHTCGAPPLGCVCQTLCGAPPSAHAPCGSAFAVQALQAHPRFPVRPHSSNLSGAHTVIDKLVSYPCSSGSSSP